jgi:ribosomal protein S18 acetylase RimI-like enzyme
MEIRPARRGDAAALRAIDVATWSPDVTPAPGPGAPAGVAGVLVAIADGTVAGYVKLGRPTPLESNRHVFEIQGLAVHPDRQGRGRAQALLEAAADDAVARGARKLTLRVLGPNARARRLYEAFGFVTEGVLRQEFLLAGRYVDDVQMALDLSPRARPGAGR